MVMSRNEGTFLTGRFKTSLNCLAVSSKREISAGVSSLMPSKCRVESVIKGQRYSSFGCRNWSSFLPFLFWFKRPGKPKFCYHFINDEYEGEVTEWDATGQLYRRMHYKQGREDGLQQMWWSDGKLRANYVVKEGKSYGLIGRKLCINNDSTTKQ